MKATVEDISPSGQKYIDTIRAEAESGKASTPSSGSGSGSSGSGSSGSGSSGGSGGGNTGGAPSSGNAGEKRGMSVRTWILTICSVITGLAMVYLIMWRTTPAGIEIQKSETVLEGKKEDTEQIRARKKLVDAERKLVAQRQKDARTTSPAVASNNCVNAAGAGIRRVQAIELVYGTCVAFTATSTQNAFWVSFKGPPKSVSGGGAVFATFHNATEAEQAERFSACMSKTNDREHCNAEKEKEKQGKVGIRDDLGCRTSESPDKCLGYLKGKADQGANPVWVQTSESVQINM
ncbi:MAG: hypothetical protein ACAH17_01210 [Candidatus Paceibacterota bacterium]